MSTQPLLRGPRRMRELATLDRARVEVVSKELLDGLPRPVTPVDRAMALSVATAIARLERRIADGLDAGSARRALAAALAGSPFEPESARALASN